MSASLHETMRAFHETRHQRMGGQQLRRGRSARFKATSSKRMELRAGGGLSIGFSQ